MFYKLVKRVPRSARNVLQAVNQSGGVRAAWDKSLTVLRSEGVSGLGNRLLALMRRGNEYSQWISQYDALSEDARGLMRSRSQAFAIKPLISIVMPTYNSNPKWLAAAIESVRAQIYSNWELCIADDASTDARIPALLKTYAAKDSRIKIILREKNGHISAASNSALDIASGEWVALLDHDDLLSESALFWVVDAINNHADVSLIYSDEDKVNKKGQRFSPYFKCDWNLDLFYSHNLITHLGVYRTQMVRDVGGFRTGFEGAQDYDLALRCVEQLAPRQIHHIPRVLYHWRVHSGSTAKSSNAKPYAMLAGERALCEHFARQGISAHAELMDHCYRVRYELPTEPPLVSLVIPTRNGLHLLKRCVGSILEKTTYKNFEILIVDNGSDDPDTLQYLDHLKTDSRVRVLRDDRPFNFSALNNGAAKVARGEILGLLNNDLEVIAPDWLSEMVSLAIQPRVGAVGAKLLYPNNTLQHAGVILLGELVAGHAHKGLPRTMLGYAGRANIIQGFSAVTGACLLVKKSIYDEVGGLNEQDLQVAFNDVDFCLRVREAGYRNVWTPYAELYHHESATRGYEDTPEKIARFHKECQYMKHHWGELLANDPAYNPNLTLSREDFSLACPPRVHGVM